MRTNSVIVSSILLSVAHAAVVPSEPWSTLTPTGSIPTDATTDFSASFGIQIKTISTAASTSASKRKRDAINQIGDGQIQKQSGSLSTPVAVTTASVVNQIGDGQIQHQTAQTTTLTTASVVNQIGDGQIQHQTAQTTTLTTASVVNQIGDGQIQHQTSASNATAINQISDGQIQHQTVSVASQISDGQVQNPTATASAESNSDSLPVACIGSTSLAMTLENSMLHDSKGRVGAIVANRQFQFDGPPPQAGSIYAAGWSIQGGLLALGNQTTFYQCQSGDFYNLYDENVAKQCSAVELEVIQFEDC